MPRHRTSAAGELNSPRRVGRPLRSCVVSNDAASVTSDSLSSCSGSGSRSSGSATKTPRGRRPSRNSSTPVGSSAAIKTLNNFSSDAAIIFNGDAQPSTSTTPIYIQTSENSNAFSTRFEGCNLLSILGTVFTVKDHIGVENFRKLSVDRQQHLLHLLPKADRQIGEDGLLKPTFSAMKNEYISAALLEFNERLLTGEISPDQEIFSTSAPTAFSESSRFPFTLSSISPITSIVSAVKNRRLSSVSGNGRGRGGRSGSVSVASTPVYTSSVPNLVRRKENSVVNGKPALNGPLNGNPTKLDLSINTVINGLPKPSNRSFSRKRRGGAVPTVGRAKRANEAHDNSVPTEKETVYYAIRGRPFPPSTSFGRRCRTNNFTTVSAAPKESQASTSYTSPRKPGRPPKSALDFNHQIVRCPNNFSTNYGARTRACSRWMSTVRATSNCDKEEDCTRKPVSSTMFEEHSTNELISRSPLNFQPPTKTPPLPRLRINLAKKQLTIVMTEREGEGEKNEDGSPRIIVKQWTTPFEEEAKSTNSVEGNSNSNSNCCMTTECDLTNMFIKMDEPRTPENGENPQMCNGFSPESRSSMDPEEEEEGETEELKNVEEETKNGIMKNYLPVQDYLRKKFLTRRREEAVRLSSISSTPPVYCSTEFGMEQNDPDRPPRPASAGAVL